MESAEETCFLCHFYREGRFVTNFHSSSTTTTITPSTTTTITTTTNTTTSITTIITTKTNTTITTNVYREGRFASQTLTPPTRRPPPLSPKVHLSIFCISTLSTDWLVCGRNWSKHRNSMSLQRVFVPQSCKTHFHPGDVSEKGCQLILKRHICILCPTIALFWFLFILLQ